MECKIKLIGKNCSIDVWLLDLSLNLVFLLGERWIMLCWINNVCYERMISGKKVKGGWFWIIMKLFMVMF